MAQQRSFGRWAVLLRLLPALIAAAVLATLIGTAPALAASRSRPFSSAPFPTVSGTPSIGSTLRAVPGRWAPAPTTLRYRWTSDGVPLRRATGSTYRLTAADLGRRIGVRVTGARRGFTTTTRTSRATAAVGRPFTTVPRASIVGNARIGEVLRLRTSQPWSPVPTRTVFRWYADGVLLASATGATFIPTTAEVGKRISGSIEVRRPGWTTTVLRSAATAAVPGPHGTVTVSGNDANGTWSPDAADVYRIVGDVRIRQGAVLTLAPGTRVTVAPGARIQVFGTLRALGDVDDPVVISSSAATPAAGDWAGLDVEEGGSLSLSRATVSDTATAITATRATAGIVVTDSVVRRSRSGVQVEGSGVTIERSDVDGGIAIRRGDDSSEDADAIVVEGSTIRRAPLFVSSRDRSRSAVPIVVRDNTVVGVPRSGRSLWGDVLRWHPVQVTDRALRPSNLTGNRVQGNAVPAIALAGTLVEDWTVPLGDTQYVVAAGECCGGAGLDVASGTRLTIPAGGVLKMDDGAGLTVLGELDARGTAALPVVVTSEDDGTAGIGSEPGATPAEGAWRGISVSGGTATLEHARVDFTERALTAWDSTVTATDSLLLHAKNVSRLTRSSSVITGTTVDGGLALHRGTAASAPTARIVVRNDLISGGPLTVLSENADPSSEPVVVEDTVLRDVVRDPWEMPTYPIQVWDAALRPSRFTGNTLAGGGQPAFAVGGTLIEDWTPPAGTWHYVLSAAMWPFASILEWRGPSSNPDTALTVQEGRTLTLPAGSVLKVERDPSSADVEHVFVDGSVVSLGSAADPAIITTVVDDSVDGDLNGDGSASTPRVEEWSGLVVGPHGVVPTSGLDVRYGAAVH